MNVRGLLLTLKLLDWELADRVPEYLAPDSELGLQHGSCPAVAT